MELAIQLAWAAREWSKSRPLKTSWRGFSLGAALVTNNWVYDAYNTKPLQDAPVEEQGYPKVRICAEQQAIFFANEADDVDIQLITLVGYHHNDGNGHMPKPCGACLRYFTALPNHRDITMVLINADTGEKVLHNIGEIIDSAELPAVECNCCTTSIDLDVSVADKYPHLS
jgi:cytidine deaminase